MEGEKFQEILEEEYSDVEVMSLKGTNNKTDRIEAIKAINMTDLGERTIQKIQEQIVIMKNLDHPHIVKVHNTFRKNNKLEDYLFIIMEYCDSTLTQTIQAHPEGVPQKEALDLLQQIIEGIAYLHGENILHRDLKPESVFITKGIVKIGDFNITKLDVKGKTSAGTKINFTPEYAPPERFSKLTMDTSMDSWGIAMLYYEMRFGRKCFGGENVDDLIRNITALRYTIPESADSLDRKILEVLLVKQGKRPSVAEFQKILCYITNVAPQTIVINCIYCIESTRGEKSRGIAK